MPEIAQSDSRTVESVIVNKKKFNGGDSSRGTSSTGRANPIPLHKRLHMRFPVARVARYLKRAKLARRVSVGASVFATAAVEYLVSELLSCASDKVLASGKTRVKPRHIQLAIADDLEMSELLNGVVIADGGARPDEAKRMMVANADKKKVYQKRKYQSTKSSEVSSSKSTDKKSSDKKSSDKKSSEKKSSGISKGSTSNSGMRDDDDDDDAPTQLQTMEDDDGEEGQSDTDDHDAGSSDGDDDDDHHESQEFGPEV